MPKLPKLPETPELEKMRGVREESQKIGQFLDWLRGEGMQIVDGDDEPLYLSIEQLLAKYFEIDLEKVEEERRALLAYQRALNEVA